MPLLIAGYGFALLALYCVIRIILSFTQSTVTQLKNKANTISHNGTMVYKDGANFIHLSAINEAAKVKGEPPADYTEDSSPPQIESPYGTEQVLFLYSQGRSIASIVKDTGLSRYKIQKIIEKDEKTHENT